MIDLDAVLNATVNLPPTGRTLQLLMVNMSNTTGEAARIEALRALDVLDTPPEAEFDAIAAGALHLFGCKFAFVSLIDTDRQWLKAACGLPARCLIPRFDGAILSLEWKEAVWDRYVTGAPRPRTLSEQQYSDRKLRSRR